MITLTTNEIVKCEPCDRFYTKYLPALGKDKPDDEPFTFAQIAKVVSFEDIIWCLGCLNHKYIGKRIEFVRRCADRVAYLISDVNREKDNNSYSYARRSIRCANSVDADDVFPLFPAHYVRVVQDTLYYALQAVTANAAGKYRYATGAVVADAARKKERAEQLKILLEIMGREE